MPKSSFDAQRLLHWRDPTKSAPRSAASGNGGIIGEFTGVLYEVLQHRVGNAWSSFTVGEVTIMRERERGRMMVMHEVKGCGTDYGTDYKGRN